MQGLAPDPRKSVLDAALRRHQYRQDALIEVLHTLAPDPGQPDAVASPPN